MSNNRRKQSAVLTKIISSITEEEKRHTRDRMKIAVKIADALEMKKLSQRGFAELMGKSESEISEWLSGNRNFTIDTLSDISNKLGISLLSVSDMRVKRISTNASHIKSNKTRSPYPYTMSQNNTFSNIADGWATLNNLALA